MPQKSLFFHAVSKYSSSLISRKKFFIFQVQQSPTLKPLQSPNHQNQQMKHRTKDSLKTVMTNLLQHPSRKLQKLAKLPQNQEATNCPYFKSKNQLRQFLKKLQRNLVNLQNLQRLKKLLKRPMRKSKVQEGRGAVRKK